MTNLDKYRNFCITEESIPLFSKDWWLDCTCGKGNWNVSIVENNNKIIAALPYQLKKKIGFKYILNPTLTPRLGIWLNYPEGQNYINKLGYEKKIIYNLTQQLPKYHYFCQSFHQNLTNWLPFFWKGYSQTTKYTYIIDDDNYENIIQNYSTTAKRGLRIALNKLQVKENLNSEQFYKLLTLTFNKQKRKNIYSQQTINNLIDECYKRKCGNILYAVDNNKNIHSALFYAWDSNYLILIAEGNNYKMGNSYAKYLLFDEAIKHGISKGLKIDFEGSIIQPIEHVNRQFGGKQAPYFEISKINSFLIKTYFLFKKNN